MFFFSRVLLYSFIIQQKCIPNNLKWYERDGLNTWYLQNKLNEFLEDTDSHFKQTKTVNFDIIENGIDESKLKQYNQIDHVEIKKYPVENQKQIMTSIFCNMNRKDLFVQKKPLMNIFKITKLVDMDVVNSSKKFRDNSYASYR